MNRFTTRRGDELHYSGWLVADSGGGLKLARGEPQTGRGEIAVSVTIKVPMGLFRKPLLNAVVTVPPGAGISNAEAIQAVVDVVETGCAFDVDVSAAP